MKPPVDTLIINGEALITSENKIKKTKINIGITKGKFSFLGTEQPPASQVYDAKNLLVLPGVVDSQVHFREPGLTHKEDLESGSKAAALGGITAFFEMPNTSPATKSVQELEDKLQRSQGRCWTHYAFFGGGAPDNIDKLLEMENHPHCSGIKIFMGSSTGSLLVDREADLEKIYKNTRRRLVLHSEDEEILRSRRSLAEQSGQVQFHPEWRSVESAVRSTERAIRLAVKHSRPIHILHVSSLEELELIKQAQKSFGTLVTAEALPNHLLLEAPDCYDRLGTKAQQNPPIREGRHRIALWRAIQENVIKVIGSDHAPHTLEEKSLPYPNSPSGTPGVQTMLPLLLNEIHSQNLSWEKLIELVCENPRWVFGLQNKGRIELGADGDLTLVDPKMEKVIESSWLASKSNWSPFEGKKVTGWPVKSFLLGNLLLSEGQLVGAPSGSPCHFST